jgi:hypothetical protein
MLTIVNILKLQGQPLVDGWEVKLVYEGNHNGTYIFELVKDDVWSFTPKHCKIMLERTGHKIFGQPDLSYFFIKDSQRTNVCVSANYIADKDNMIQQLENILQKYKDI